MNPANAPHFRNLPRLIALPLAACALGVVGCTDREVQVYSVPKEARPAPVVEVAAGATPPAAGAPAAAAPAADPTAPTPMMPGSMAGQTLPSSAIASGPNPTWSVPSHWGAGTASSMRKGSFAVTDPALGAIDIAITAFPGDVGGLLPNLNRWRQQLGLGPISTAEMPQAARQMRMGANDVVWADFTGPGETPSRTLVASIANGGSTWFVKATGDARLVGREEESFKAFVASIVFPPAR